MKKGAKIFVLEQKTVKTINWTAGRMFDLRPATPY